MASEETVRKALAKISRLYPGRFEVVPGMADDWMHVLDGVDDREVKAAVLDLCATEGWPPACAKVRARALDLAAGELAPVGPYEAWGRVRKSLHDKTVALSDIEKQALNQIGGTWELKNGNTGTMGHFVRAYDGLLKKQRRLRAVLPSVASVAAANTPALPTPADESPRLEESHEMGAEPEGSEVEG